MHETSVVVGGGKRARAIDEALEVHSSKRRKQLSGQYVADTGAILPELRRINLLSHISPIYGQIIRLVEFNLARYFDPRRSITCDPVSASAPTPESTWLPGVKVSTALPAESPSKAVAIRVRDDDLGPDRDSHRGRARERELQRENLQALLNANSGAEFWKLVRGWTDPKPRSALVTAGQLRNVFEERLNPPSVLPEHFNVEEHEWNSFMAGNIPAQTFEPLSQ
ncbi:hypothetical protein B0H14DRAFT_3125349 [Mycena olivaceomarginata]|nr:hypothetical protein B0H14DRAFT_3125349 [Mycena olivaceomarginata]